MRGALRCASEMTMPDANRHLIAGFHSRSVLPHLKREGGTYFVVFRQAGTLPKEKAINNLTFMHRKALTSAPSAASIRAER